MAADTITIPREQVFEAAAWLFAFEELFEAVEEECPSSFRSDDDDWYKTVFTLVEALAGTDVAALDDDAFERQPVLVELYARARDIAARMVRNIQWERGDDGPLAFRGDPFTAHGLRELSKRLQVDAISTRAQGVIHPPTEQHA
jgi:hypothetical protein